MSSHEVYLLHRDTIERALKAVCQRQRIAAHDADDFCSSFRLRLMEDDYGVLRKFQGRSSMQTYLVTVVTHFFQDWRNARWGKWRPSAEARRLGMMAVRFETLYVRDQAGFDQTYETLRTEYGEDVSRLDLEALAARLPARVNRTFLPETSVIDLPAPDPRPDVALEQHEAARSARRAVAEMRSAVAALAPQDRLIVRMLVEDNLSIADIARTLHLEQKPLYRRIQQVLMTLRNRLEKTGLSSAVVAEVLEHGGFDTLMAEGLSREIPEPVRLSSRDGHSPDAKGGTS